MIRVVVRTVGVVVSVLIGLWGAVFLGQGLGFIKGSFMTGSAQWAVVGLAMIALAGWLIWNALRRRTAVRDG